MMKKKGYKKGGAMKKKPVAMKSGGKMPMVKKNGKSVPAFAADGVGKMKKGGVAKKMMGGAMKKKGCLLYTSPSPRDRTRSRMPSSA